MLSWAAKLFDACRQTQEIDYEAEVRADPEYATRPDDEIVSEARTRLDKDWWDNHKQPFLKQAFERGDDVRYISDPMLADSTFRSEVDAIEQPGGLAGQHGYEYDASTFTWTKTGD